MDASERDGDVTGELRAEHELIRAYLALFGELAHRSDGAFEEAPLAARFPALRAFLEQFAAEFHHTREEQVLFAGLAGLLTHCNPVEQMLYEHRLMEELRGAMDDSFGAGDLAGLVEVGLDFCQLLEEHIFKEDHVLYPMAERLIPAAARAALRERYAEASARLDGASLRTRFERELEALRASLG